MIATYPSQTMAWHELISDAEQKSKQELEEDLKSYLILLLMRIMKRPEIVSGVVALDYLYSILHFGKAKKESLRDVGDKCLILSGFFPKQATKRGVKTDYFISIGSSAYHNLSEELSRNNRMKELSRLFMLVSEKFVTMMIVLLAVKMLDEKENVLSPLLAHELQGEIDSPFLMEELTKNTQSETIFLKSGNNVKH
jgi:hypothetical protein